MVRYSPHKCGEILDLLDASGASPVCPGVERLARFANRPCPAAFFARSPAPKARTARDRGRPRPHVSAGRAVGGEQWAGSPSPAAFCALETCGLKGRTPKPCLRMVGVRAGGSCEAQPRRRRGLGARASPPARCRPPQRWRKSASRRVLPKRNPAEGGAWVRGRPARTLPPAAAPANKRKPPRPVRRPSARAVERTETASTDAPNSPRANRRRGAPRGAPGRCAPRRSCAASGAR